MSDDERRDEIMNRLGTELRYRDVKLGHPNATTFPVAFLRR